MSLSRKIVMIGILGVLTLGSIGVSGKNVSRTDVIKPIDTIGIDPLSAEERDIQYKLTKATRSISKHSTGVKASSIRLYANITADQVFVNNYGGWRDAADTALAKSCENVNDWYGIRYIPNKYFTFTSPSTSSADTLYNNFRTNYNDQLTDDADFLVGFGRSSSDVGGRAERDGCYVLIFDQNSSTKNGIALSHEAGHLFDLGHCNNKCIMNGTNSAYDYFNSICSTHDDEWYANRNKNFR